MKEKQIYAREIGKCGNELIEAANRYADHSETANFKTEEELEEFKKGWFAIVQDFRMIQSRINKLEIPKGHEEDGARLRQAYQKYVDYVEEKTIKFGDVDHSEIQTIQKHEYEQSQKIKELSEKLARDMFP